MLPLFPQGWATNEWSSGCSGRVDSECLYGNTCSRLFTDYSGVVGCYPEQGQRCFNDGAPCGHQLVEDFEMWVRPARVDPSLPPTASCANIGQPGIAQLAPAGIEHFDALCDEDGFMKMMQEKYLLQ